MIVAAAASGPAEARPGDFEAALRSELRSLRAEQKVLREALDGATEAGRSAESALERELELLTASLAQLRASNTSYAERLPGQERARSLEQEVRRTERLTNQMRAWLHTRGSTVAQDAGLEAIFRASVEWLQTKGRARVVATPTFGVDGQERTLPVLHIGQVGAVALGPSASPLVLADDGTYRVAPGWIAKPSVSTGEGRLVDAILFDPQAPDAPSTYAEGGWLDWLRRGGPIMWPLALLGLFGAIIALERTYRLTVTSFGLRASRQAQAAPGAPHGVLGPLHVAESGAIESEDDRVTTEDRLAEAIRQSRARLRQGLFFVAVVAAAAPLVGLLGTVTGMIGTFSVITEHGTGDPRLLSAGISEALLTTQLGLTIAVPALLAHALLMRWASRLGTELETQAMDILTRRSEGAHG